jgi:hypothetical protein
MKSSRGEMAACGTGNGSARAERGQSNEGRLLAVLTASSQWGHTAKSGTSWSTPMTGSLRTPRSKPPLPVVPAALLLIAQVQPWGSERPISFAYVASRRVVL